jgi:Peptidase C39 family
MLINPLAVPTIVVAGTLFWAGFDLFRKFSPRAARGCLLLFAFALALPCILCDLFYTHLFDSWTWFYSFRAIRLSELSIAGVGLLAGLIYGWLEPETFGEKLVVPVVLLVLVGLPFAIDVAALRTVCNNDVCLQSTPSTCGPSSAATILKLYGVMSSERELATEAFTYRGGTENWYLARAMRRRGLTTRFIVQSPDSLSIPSPSIAGVVLEGGAGHFIAVLSATGDEVIIADPLVGKLNIRTPDLPKRYHFTGFFLLVRRKS